MLRTCFTAVRDGPLRRDVEWRRYCTNIMMKWQERCVWLLVVFTFVIQFSSSRISLILLPPSSNPSSGPVYTASFVRYALVNGGGEVGFIQDIYDGGFGALGIATRTYLVREPLTFGGFIWRRDSDWRWLVTLTSIELSSHWLSLLYVHWNFFIHIFFTFYKYLSTWYLTDIVAVKIYSSHLQSFVCWQQCSHEQDSKTSKREIPAARADSFSSVAIYRFCF